LFLVTEPVTGQLVEPMLYGRSTGLSPIAVVLSVIFWGWLWGPVGLILSTPIMLCLVVLGRHVNQLEFLSILFGDRPPLSRAESFYQRLLAGDEDELQEQAEQLLKSMSLASYYDDIVIEGLELAAHDLARQVLSAPQFDQIKQSLHTLVGELDLLEDVQANDHSVVPRELEAKSLVSCIAARSDLDELVATMLAQIVRKTGFHANVISHTAVTRTSIGSFGGKDFKVLCLCYLDVSGSTSSLRFLIRRIRHRVPDALSRALSGS
jgi:hypothetical protein